MSYIFDLWLLYKCNYVYLSDLIQDKHNALKALIQHSHSINFNYNCMIPIQDLILEIQSICDNVLLTPTTYKELDFVLNLSKNLPNNIYVNLAH